MDALFWTYFVGILAVLAASSRITNWRASRYNGRLWRRLQDADLDRTEVEERRKLGAVMALRGQQ